MLEVTLQRHAALIEQIGNGAGSSRNAEVQERIALIERLENAALQNRRFATQYFRALLAQDDPPIDSGNPLYPAHMQMQRNQAPSNVIRLMQSREILSQSAPQLGR